MKRIWLPILFALLLPAAGAAADTDVGETTEVQFSSSGAADLNAAALALTTPVAIYEHVRNRTDHALYHGSRSGSINTYLGQRGNDVDQASTLIALLRARGMPARYAVATVRVATPKVMNWLKVKNPDLAASILDDQGIQSVLLSADKATIDFEHAWVEVQVPFDSYRGSGSEVASVNCATTPNACHWIALDPSFKQHVANPNSLDPYSALSFDYTAYYNAIAANDATRRDKNPLEIYQEQVMAWLRSTYPGKTLTDIAEFGDIVPETSGILPASLPYSVVGPVRRYNSIDDHDAVVPASEPKKWGKTATISTYLCAGVSIGSFTKKLVDLATHRLTSTVDGSGSTISQSWRLDSVPISGSTITASQIYCNGQLIVPAVGTPYTIGVSMDGAPATTVDGIDGVVSASYQAVIGGYYLLATGGETSNWSQTHRAAQQLLDANRQYRIVFNPGETACQPGGMDCTPYVDLNTNGWDASDPKLLDNKPALDALTGGLLNVAATQYYAKLREQWAAADALNKVKTPVVGFLGLVSSTHEAEYIDGTAFSVLPGGLLIDMKGIRIGGSWRIDQPAVYAGPQFEFAGHIMSSLEHETWQELTGYDAISTVRGIQMALASGATLLNPKKNQTTDNMSSIYAALGFTSGAAPTGFTYKPFNIAGTQPATWTHATDGATFYLMLAQENTATTSLRMSLVDYVYSTSSGLSLYAWSNCVQNQITTVNTYPTNVWITGNSCAGTAFAGYKSTVLSAINNDWTNNIIPNRIGQSYFSFFDVAQGFVPANYVYRATPIAANAHFSSFVQHIRDELYLRDTTQSWAEFIVPSQQSVGPNFKFTVDVEKTYETSSGHMSSATFAILNNTGVSAGGGYVPANGTQLRPATSIAIAGSSSVVPTFNNATLTDKNTIAEANNNVVRTPSTIDPVSTVTGNNYHDETDFTIKGRAGLNYAFTRTYNSAPSTTKTDLGLGNGWVHSYGMRLVSNDYGNCPNCTSAQAVENGNSKTSSITYTDERGGDHNYLVNESSYVITAPQGEFDSLAFNAPSSGQHTLTFRNGTKYIFQTVGASDIRTTPNVTARLIQIADPWGNQLNFTYHAANGRLATVADNLGIAGRTGLVFTYDAANHLQSIADWTGRSWQYGGVNAGGSPVAYHLASYTNALNQATSYGYATGSNNLTTIGKPLRGVQTTFSYYQNGRTFNYHDALGSAETLDYDLYRKSTRVTDPRGGVREYEYDSAGRMTKLSEPDGAILFFENQADGLRYSKTDGIGYKTQYSYRADKSFNSASDTFGNVTREQDALNYTVDTTYGPYDQVATVKDKRGTVMTTTFHSGSGACIAAGKPNTVTISSLNGVANVRLKSYCWNTDGTLASQTDYLSPTDLAKTRVTAYTYDTAAHLNVQAVTVTGWDGVTVARTYTYDSLGRQKTETQARRISPTNAATVNLTTTNTWDVLDRVTQIDDAAGNRVINRYDANGKVWQLTHQYKRPDASFDTRDLVTRTFDAADRVKTETDAQGGVTSYAYDAAGNVISVTDPENHTLTYEYDAMNRRTSVTDANGRTVKTTYDLAGHPVAVANGANETVSTAYDPLGRPVSVTDPHGYVSTVGYDANNNRSCVVDANAQAGLQPKNSDGCTVSTQYDELNRPILIRDALNGVTQTSYDLLSNPLTLTDAEGRQYAWSYDGLGRLYSETDVAGRATTYVRDEAGNPWQETNRLNQVTRVTYDLLNRPTEASYLADGGLEGFAYDPAGNLTGASNADIAYTFQYDTLNRLLSKTDSRGRSLGFTWDRAGHVLTKTTYQGSTTSYTYDGAGTLVSLTNPDYLTVNYQYDDAGRLLARVMSSGARSFYTYDTGGWLDGLSHRDATGATVASQTYTRDRVGNLTGMTVVTGNLPGAYGYTLDARYQLTGFDAPGTLNDESFSYDRVGNRLTATRLGTTHYYSYTPASRTGSVPGYTPTYHHRLQEVRSGSPTGTLVGGFTFDNEGRVTSQTGGTPRTLTWDGKGRLKTLAQSGTTETYRYDPSDHRIGRSGGALGNLDYYLEGEHLESVEQNGALQEKYFRGSTIDELVAGYLNQSGKLVPILFQHDALTSVTAQTKSNGGTLATMAYRPFGETLSATGTPAGRLKYTGREDDGTGYYYYRARYYDKTLGGFISEDPLRFAAGPSFYTYVGNNPTNANDPSGHAAMQVGGAIVGGVGGLVVQGGIDLARGRLSSFADYAGALTGGAAGGAAAVTCGPACAGATAGAVSSATTQGISWAQGRATSALNAAGNFVIDTALGAVGGKVAGEVVPYVFKNYVSNPVKGAIGEAMTWLDLVGSGRGLPQTQVLNGAGKNGRSTFDFLTDAGTYVESKFGTAGLSSPQRTAAGRLGDAFELQSWNYPTVSGLAGSSFAAGSAGGGFLLYPNKANTNMMQSVYAK